MKDLKKEELKAQREIIASLQREMSARFESVEKRLLFLQWFMAGGFTFISVLIPIPIRHFRHSFYKFSTGELFPRSLFIVTKPL